MSTFHRICFWMYFLCGVMVAAGALCNGIVVSANHGCMPVAVFDDFDSRHCYAYPGTKHLWLADIHSLRWPPNGLLFYSLGDALMCISLLVWALALIVQFIGMWREERNEHVHP